MLFLKILILLVLLLIFIQDFRSRSVYWIIFPLLVISLLFLRYLQPKTMTSAWQPALINLGFILIQLFWVSVYFSLKHKRLTNITHQLLGGGDIFFLLSIAFYLSVLNFLFFYIISLILILLAWTIWQIVSSEKSKEIPLAGFQALIFVLFLAGDWWVKLFDLTDNTWLLNLISK